MNQLYYPERGRGSYSGTHRRFEEEGDEDIEAPTDIQVLMKEITDCPKEM